MSETWYETGETFNSIKPVQVDRVTDKNVYIGGRRCLKESWKSYFPTWDEVKAYLVGRAIDAIAEAEKTVEHRREKLLNAQNLKPPTVLSGAGE